MGVLLRQLVEINQQRFGYGRSVKYKSNVETYGYNQVHHMLLLVS